MYSKKDSLKALVLGAVVARAELPQRFYNGSGVVYTTEVVTAITTYCPGPTVLPIGNKTYTITAATTLTITDCPCTIHKPQPTGPVGGGDECAKKCNDEFDKCSNAPDANHSFCASKLADCVGYNPFGGSGYVKPTACSAAPAPTQPAGGKDCAAKCVDSYRQCQVAPNTNRAVCASDLATCVGYNPFGASGFVVPTACSAGPAGPVVTPPAGGSAGGKDCAAKCVAAFNQCQTAPDANHSFCASQLASCVGYNPFTEGSTFTTPTACSAGMQPTGTAPGAAMVPSGTPPPGVTAGAGHMTPAMALLALGAVVLL
ncbi:hypothetical protein E4U42_001839 [Claviceps africana]|uniref:Cell wall glycoprotein n=1 Tax=Claviceps africana TaxID=83212 RepID=A0A8K0JBF0_9HYPO|nr:hypothetical protein E4U42_001839 [Claviceps africana]